MKHAIKQNTEIFKERSGGVNTKIIEFDFQNHGKKVFKFSYSSGNAYEHFNIESFDGDKLHHVFNITDLGFKRNTSAYCTATETEFKNRVKELTEKGIEFVKSLYS